MCVCVCLKKQGIRGIILFIAELFIHLTYNLKEMQFKKPTTCGEWEYQMYTYTLNDNLANLRRYILKSNRLTDAEKDSIKEKIVVDI